MKLYICYATFSTPFFVSRANFFVYFFIKFIIRNHSQIEMAVIQTHTMHGTPHRFASAQSDDTQEKKLECGVLYSMMPRNAEREEEMAGGLQ